MLYRNGSVLKLKYQRNMVLEKLRKNLAKHLANYEKAKTIYYKELVALLKAKLKDAENGKQVNHQINLHAPVEYSEQYEQAISMIESTTEEEIELNGELYAQLILDKWEWAETFEACTNSYLGGKKRSR